MSATIVARTVTISKNDDGTVRSIKGDMWQTTDDAGNAITPRHYGTKTTFTNDELKGLFPNADLAASVAALTAERDELSAAVEPLKNQLRALKGTPAFNAVDLLAQITDAEKEHITQFVANNAQLRALWAAFLTRVTGGPIPIDSPTFVAAADGLKQALGEIRVVELFKAINIDLMAGAYINLAVK